MSTGFGRFKNSREYCILDLLWNRKYSVEQRDGTIKRRMQGRLNQNKYHINKLGKKFRYLYTRCWWYIIVAKNRKKWQPYMSYDSKGIILLTVTQEYYQVGMW